MKRILYICFIFILMYFKGSITFAQTASDPFYPDNAELQSQLQNLAENYSDIVQYVELGYSTFGGWPIMALKISDNVKDAEDEPVWIFTGYIHGAEQLGLRVLLNLANELALGYGNVSTITDWVNAYEIWLVMDLNPWGYENMTRKNGPSFEDPNVSGVDLNRNFDSQWGTRGSSDPSSYEYKGEAPFSEKETQAIRELYLQRKPVFGITYHQGNDDIGGQIFSPWTSGSDVSMLAAHRNNYAGWVENSRSEGPFCQKDSSGNYILHEHDCPSCSLCTGIAKYVAGTGGYLNNWSYQKVGTVDFMTEISRDLYNGSSMHTADGPQYPYEQTVKEIATEFARNHTEALKSWFQHFLYATDPFRFMGPGITGHITDAQTGAPLKATIEVEGTTNKFNADRTSDETFGRFWRLLPTGKRIIKISAPGYDIWQDTLDILDNTPLTEIEIALMPWSTLAEEETVNTSKEYHISPVYPNPFNSQIQFSLRVNRSQKVEIVLYNMPGKKITTFHNDFIPDGVTNTFNFETRGLPSGTYLLQIRGQYFNTVKLLSAAKE